MLDDSPQNSRVAIYARVSTDEQREGQTIKAQVSELEQFSRQKAWPLTKTYEDDGWSGSVLERPALDRLRDDARQGLFDIVIVNDVDRMARDVAHLGIIKRDLERAGVRLVFRKLPSDGSPTYNLMVNILGSFAEFEKEMILDRTRRGRRYKIEVAKKYLGCNSAYGLRYIRRDPVKGVDGYLEIVPDEAVVVRRMYDWVDLEGLSAGAVLKRLNALNIAPRKGGKTWNRSSVLCILRNEIYAGVWYYNKVQAVEPQRPDPRHRYRKTGKTGGRRRARTEWIPVPIDPALHILSREQWDRVQRRLTQNISYSPRNEKHFYLLKGLLRCGGCGHRYVGDPARGKFAYRCRYHCKERPSIRTRMMDAAVKRAVAQVMTNPDVILDPLRRLQSEENSKARKLQEEAATAAAETAKIDQEEQRILEAYRLQILSAEQLSGQLELLRARRGRLATMAQQSDTEVMAVAPIEKPVTDYCAVAKRNLANFADTEWREFLRTIVDVIVVDRDQITIRGRIPLPGKMKPIRFEWRSGVDRRRLSRQPHGAKCAGRDTACAPNVDAEL